MPMYYDLDFSHTTNASGGTLSTAPLIRMLTDAGVDAQIKGIYAGARSSTAGGGLLRVFTAGTAYSSNTGTAYVLRPRNPAFPTATTCAATTMSCTGATSNLRLSVGFAQTGGMGGWVAIEPDAAVMLRSAGGANGNLEVESIANAASVLVDVTMELSEN